MISAVMLINMKGEIIVSRFYRDNVDRKAADVFRLKVIAAKETGKEPPIKLIDGTNFVYIRHENLYLVACSRSNANPAMTLHFLQSLVHIFSAYFNEGKKLFNEERIRDNFTLVYELLDEVMDFGYPQNSSVETLQLYINTGKMKADFAANQAELMPEITGKIDWRNKDIFHRKNEVFIDVTESVGLLMSASGQVLRSEVNGVVTMKSLLSGMPECKFGLNDKVAMDKEKKKKAGRRPQVELADCTFHRCVQLGKFDADRSITFIPPDGKFDLMKYRITSNVNLPFKVLPHVEESPCGTSAKMVIKAKANFSEKLFANKVVFKIPCPPNTATAEIKTTSGSAKYVPEKRGIIWRIRKFAGGDEEQIDLNLVLMESVSKKKWNRPPLSLNFEVPMFTSSGLHVRYLKIFEKSGYKPTKWVRYVSKAGSYEHRI